MTVSEVKSLRPVGPLTDSYVRINDTQATIYNFQIDRYPSATDQNHEPSGPPAPADRRSFAKCSRRPSRKA